MSDIDELIGQLGLKRDELRVRMHLASRDLQDDWAEMEEKAEAFVGKAGLGETGEGVTDALSQVGVELKKGYQRISDAMKEK